MKTASVRDIRLRFAEVAKWVEEGEEVAVTRRGVVIATLGPPKPAAPATPPAKPDWAVWIKQHPPIKRKKPLNAEETAEFYQQMRGRY